MKKVMVIPVIVGALGAISTCLKKYVAAIGIEIKVEHAQKTGLLGTARILDWHLDAKKKQYHKYQYHCARLC